MTHKPHIWARFLIWRLKHLPTRHFLMLLSVVIGLAAGLSAVIIKNSVHLIQQLLLDVADSALFIDYYFLFPILGILLVVLFIRYILRQHVGHGIPSVLFAISKNNGIIRRHNMFSSVISSAFTVGFGGSVGLEGPTVATGAALGSNLGRALRLNYRQIVLLLGCACAGAMAAIFKAPIAAIVFALEVIMLDLTLASLVPLLIASSSAYITSFLFMGGNVLYPFSLKETFAMQDIPYYLVLGIFTGLLSAYFTKTYIWVHKVFELFKSWYAKLIAGGLALGGLIYMLPSLYGEGYQAVNLALHGDLRYLFNSTLYYEYHNVFWVGILLLAAVVAFKVFATAITFGAGGIGGIFAPTLFMGVNAGLMYALVINNAEIYQLNTSNFALAGMAGMMAGVLHAPLTAIFLIAEITSGYGLFFPLMITATISFATTRLFVANSVYTFQLAKRGELMTHNKDKSVLMMMTITPLIEKNFISISPEATLGELVKTIARSKRNIFPVVESDGTFLGLVYMDNIRDIMFKPEMYDQVKVSSLMYTPAAIVEEKESMEQVANKFKETGNYNLPVLRDGKYLGFISRATVFSSYREMLKHFSEE